MAENNNENSYINRIPPHDNDAEQMVLACMLYPDEDGVRISAENLLSEDFYSPAHRLIFDAFIDLYNSSKPVDFVMAKDKLESMGYLEQTGGVEYLVSLNGLAATTAKTKYYVDIVKQKAVFRRLIKIGDSISASSYEGSDDVDTVIAKAEQDILEVSQNINSNDFVSMDRVMAEVIENIDKVTRSNSRITGIETGFKDFDRLTAGLQNSDLILIAGRPSMGKTAFALNIAQFAAVEKRVPVAIFSLEMSKAQLGNRMLSAQALVDSGKLRTGNLTPEEFDSIAMAMGTLSAAPIEIYDTPGINPISMREKCRKLKLEKGLGMIVIDYLQLMEGTGNRNESDQQRVSYISRSLKGIARELNVPVIALSQLSRGPEGRTDHRPMMSDLRESGAIEQDADVVCLLFREEYYKKDDPEVKNKGEVIVAKNRNGSTDTVNLIWRGQFTRFDNMLDNDDGFVPDIPSDMAE
ncbi:MAG: replicative DNA helicase [Clostridia bacterium]|nr:replicative DNA helicase [Clostridia bacterium]